MSGLCPGDFKTKSYIYVSHLSMFITSNIPTFQHVGINVKSFSFSDVKYYDTVKSCASILQSVDSVYFISQISMTKCAEPRSKNYIRTLGFVVKPFQIRVSFNIDTIHTVEMS
jgi:hypothetical protein